jgi:hypothetical protein
LTSEKGNFELWHEAGWQYAKDHPELDMWDFQIKEMASDFAWRMEGMDITPENVEWAYQDWISGQSPYSIHSRATPGRIEDGYDFMEQCRRDKLKATEEFKTYLLESGVDPFEVDKIAATRLSNPLYFRPEEGKRVMRDYFSGINPNSPHHVPLDPLNKALRDGRVAYINERYKPKRQSSLAHSLWVDAVKPPDQTMMKFWLDTEDED